MAPRWVVRLLSFVLDDADHDEVIGDVEELHRRRRARRGRAIAYLHTAAEGLWLVLTHGARSARSASASRAWISAIEVRLAWRMLWKQPVVTVTAVVALGVGIGMAAGGISVFQQALFSKLPWEGGERWAVIETYSADTRRRTPLELERVRLFRESSASFEYIGAFESRDFNLVHANGEVERVRGSRLSPATYRYLPYAPLLGRLLTVEDGRSGGAPVAMIRESLWLRRFAGSRDAVGSRLNVGGVRHTIVGVLPDEAGYPSDGELWVPLDEERLGAEGDRDPIAGTRAVAILAQGASWARATEELARLSSQLVAEGRGAQAQVHRITPMTGTISSPQAYLGSLLGSAILISVLLIIAMNVANLVVARTSSRASELAVRSALGASRARLVSQLSVEALVLGAVAAGPALLAAGGVLALYDRVLDELPFWISLSLEPSTAVVVVVLAVLASAVVGLLPALRATSTRSAGLLRSFGKGGRLGVGRVGEAMIVMEVALSIALIGTALLFAEGFRAYVDPRFALPDDQVLTARVRVDLDESDLRRGGAATVGDSILSLAHSLRGSLAMLPGVRAAGVSTHPPRLSPYPEPIEPEGVGRIVTAPVVYQGPGFFDVLQIEPLSGRDFEDRDLVPGAPPVLIVNQAFAMEGFGTLQVVGRRVRLAGHEPGEEGPWREVVGVVPNVMEVTAPQGSAGVYLPFGRARFFTVAIRVDANPMALTGRLRRVAFDLDPNLTVTEVVRLDQVGAENRTALGVMSSALLAIGVVTLLLSLAGVYSIVSLAVTRRTREIGVRVALGAARGSILGTVLRRSALLVGGGAVVGALLGARLSKVQPFTFAVPEAGLWLFPLLMGLMTVAACVACWVPARRALSIAPVEALREDG